MKIAQNRKPIEMEKMRLQQIIQIEEFRTISAANRETLYD